MWLLNWYIRYISDSDKLSFLICDSSFQIYKRHESESESMVVTVKMIRFIDCLKGCRIIVGYYVIALSMMTWHWFENLFLMFRCKLDFYLDNIYIYE